MQDDSQKEQRNPLFSQVGFLFSSICLPLVVTWISWKGHTTFTYMSTELKKLNSHPKNYRSRNKELLTNMSSWRYYLITGLICIAPVIAAIVTFQTNKLGTEYVTYSTSFFSLLDTHVANENSFLQFTKYVLKYIFRAFMIWILLPNPMFEAFGILLVTSCLWYVFWFEQSLEECDDIEKVILYIIIQ